MSHPFRHSSPLRSDRAAAVNTGRTVASPAPKGRFAINNSQPILRAQRSSSDAPSVNAMDLIDKLRAQLIDEIECGLVVCDCRSVVRFANQAAEREMAAASVLRRVGEILCCVGPSGELDAALRLAIDKGHRQLVRLSHGSDRLLASVLPLRPADGPETFALVVLGRRWPCSDLGLEMLANVYGLTLAERRVLSSLMKEATPSEIALAHKVAISTVRTQILSIRNKLGTRNIDGLLIRTAEVPPIASALRWAGHRHATAPQHGRAFALPVAA